MYSCLTLSCAFVQLSSPGVALVASSHGGDKPGMALAESGTSLAGSTEPRLSNLQCYWAFIQGFCVPHCSILHVHFPLLLELFGFP